MSDKTQHDGGAASPVSRINQQFIADHLGVSRTTVSRCFTNHAGISPVTRARVFDLASQLGYRHMEMRAPRKSRAPVAATVGVLICTDVDQCLSSGYESPSVELYSGLSEFAQLNKFKLDLSYVSPTERSLDDASYAKLGPLQKRGWDGVILIYPFPRSVVEEIAMRFPVVSMNEQFGVEGINCVDVDHYAGIWMMMDRLRELGHARIGFYTRRYAVEAEWSLRRFGAYMQKLVRLRMPVLPGDIVNNYPGSIFASRDEELDYIAARIADGVTAWVCAADHQAYDLIAGLEKRGIRVPRDVSVTGFDGIRKPDWAPLLTTVSVPFWEMGYTAGRRLHDMIKKRFGSPQHVLVAPGMREGETTGPIH
ncbi:MAG TPA: LacI family DNA-binding transcriptional regulator [Chthoniobacteraceae bacterium]|nr:LacI family DNA-binding transcriptional regulator [Chthoniobacteraceae bacterium]